MLVCDIPIKRVRSTDHSVGDIPIFCGRSTDKNVCDIPYRIAFSLLFACAIYRIKDV